MVISYSFRDPSAYNIKRNIQTMLVDQGLGKVSEFKYNYMKVRRAASFKLFIPKCFVKIPFQRKLLAVSKIPSEFFLKTFMTLLN